MCGERLESESGFSRECLTVTELRRKAFAGLLPKTVYYVTKDARPYYCLIRYSAAEVEDCASFLREHFRRSYTEETLAAVRARKESESDR